MRVLGLDPGTERTGWGCVQLRDDVPIRLGSGVLHLQSGSLAERLHRLHTLLVGVFAAQHPDACAIEGLFYARNVRSALHLGHARGICLLVAAANGLPVVEYAPARVKLAVAGHGAAEKERVSVIVAGLLGFDPQDSFDETDALAVALCHLESSRPLRLVE